MAGGAPVPTNVNGAQNLYVVVDAFSATAYWNGVDARTFEVEVVMPPPPTFTINDCRLQFPPSISGAAGSMSPAVYGRVFINGQTDLTVNVDGHPRILAAVGHGPVDSDPATWMAWTPAVPNMAWVDNMGPAPQPGWDEYQAIFTLPPTGTYDYAFRFSGDGGNTWTYCDLDGGNYTVDQAGLLTATPRCGDGNVEAPETCDDGNTNNGDGCNAMCNHEPRPPFISEYVEGTGNTKALELFNPGLVPITLGGACELRIHSNGSPVPTSTYQFAGGTSIQPRDTFVLCNATISAGLIPQCDVTTNSPVFLFNGDDALVLACGGSTVDVFGRVGEDPGTSWGLAPLNTIDATLRRKCDVDAGDVDGANPFGDDLVAEWDAFPVNTFSDMGMHCPAPPPP